MISIAITEKILSTTTLQIIVDFSKMLNLNNLENN